MAANDAAAFARGLMAEADAIEEVVTETVQKIALTALDGVVMMSPVDTGRFRGNWNVGIAAMDMTTTEDTDPSGAETINRGTAIIDGIETPIAVYVTNSLPYAIALENRHSKQAPDGIVRVTVARLNSIFD